jgi:DNA-binding PadR family transcriptional regulator
MALAEAILVCLTDKPKTGYEIAKTFDASVGFFWRASHQQIYRDLQQLRDDGLVHSEDVIQIGRPNKTVYTISRKGLAHIREWSHGRSERPPLRDNMLLKLYALDAIDRDAVAEEIKDRLVQHRARLALYERILTGHYSKPRLGVRETGRLLGLRVGLMTERCYVTWCEEALSTLKALEGKETPKKAAAGPKRGATRPMRRSS